jgi:hypothetical protein
MQMSLGVASCKGIHLARTPDVRKGQQGNTDTGVSVEVVPAWNDAIVACADVRGNARGSP